jgi:purine-nucleoside phosphorylase
VKSCPICKMEDALAAPNVYVRATETAQHVRSHLPESLQNPKVAIVCGSGLGGLADTIESEPKVELAYESIPNFPKSTGESISTMGCRATCRY